MKMMTRGFKRDSGNRMSKNGERGLAFVVLS
jgi:hypothetical protein